MGFALFVLAFLDSYDVLFAYTEPHKSCGFCTKLWTHRVKALQAGQLIAIYMSVKAPKSRSHVIGDVGGIRVTLLPGVCVMKIRPGRALVFLVDALFLSRKKRAHKVGILAHLQSSQPTAVIEAMAYVCAC